MRSVRFLLGLSLGLGACASSSQVEDLRAEVRLLRQEVQALQEHLGVSAEASGEGAPARRPAGRRFGGGAGKLSEPVEDGVEVQLEGDAVRVIINDVPAGTRYLLPSRVPASEYGLWAAFPDGKVRFVTKLTVAADPITVTCLGAEKTCTVD